MKNKGLLFLLVIAIVALIIVLGIYYVINNFPESSTLEEQGIVPPEATGDIDDLEDALNKEMLDEDTLIDEEDSDADIIESDNSEIDEFGQSVDEEEL